MNWLTIALGVLLIAFGIATSILRMTRPQLFAKLEAMKQRWGERAGFWLHVVGYSVVPIISGLSFALAGMYGISIF
jgi:hypothetical protein